MMRRVSLGSALMVAGLALGLAAAILFALGVEPRIPPALLRLAVYKLAFLGAVGLLGAGAVLRRRARRTRGAA